MMSIHINPQGMDDDYLAGLNASFQPWGDARAFQWYFRRETAYRPPDLIVIKEEGRPIAGSALTYRRLALPEESLVDVAIMTGSWTLPEARGRGCFTQIIETSHELATMRNSVPLLAFVTEENRSCRLLARAGATLIPSAYCVSDQQDLHRYGSAGAVPVAKDACTIHEVWQRMSLSYRHHVRFSYPSTREVEAQFVDRPGPTEILRDDAGNMAIIERKVDTDIVQVLLPTGSDEGSIAGAVAAVLRRAEAGGRRVFLYATHAAVMQACRDLGCGSKRGYIAVLMADPARGRGSGRPAPSLDEPAGLQLGPWHVHGGDRA